MIERNTLILAMGLMACAHAFAQSSPAAASDFPNKQVTFIVPFPPAGGADTLARILASHMSTVWKQQVIVENKPGASGHIGAAYVAKASPDGYKLLGKCTPPGTTDHGTAKAWTHPVISNGRLYIRDQGDIWCYDIKE